MIKSSEKYKIKSCRMISGFLGENNYIYTIFLNPRNYYNAYNICISKFDYANLEFRENKTLVSNVFNKEESGIFESGIFTSIYLKDNLAALIYFSSESIISFHILNLSCCNTKKYND